MQKNIIIKSLNKNDYEAKNRTRENYYCRFAALDRNSGLRDCVFYFYPLTFPIMTTFFCLPAYDFNGQEHQFTIATCPVVVDRENKKILLHIGTSTEKWQFIGGRYSDEATFRENAITHGKKELGE